MRKCHPKLIPCSGEHGIHEACCIRSPTFKAEFAPMAYQFSIWGTAVWEKKYAKLTKVERGFSTLKNPDVIGMSPGLYRMRGRIKMSVLIACMWVDHNLHLRMVDDERQRKGLPHLRSTPRRRRREQLEQAPTVPQPSSSPTEASRALPF